MATQEPSDAAFDLDVDEDDRQYPHDYAGDPDDGGDDDDDACRV